MKWSDLPTHPASTDSPAEGGAVGRAHVMPGASGFTMVAFKASDVPVGTPLYTRPAPIEPGVREKVARMIDPSAFLFAPDELPKGDRSQFNAFALTDRIINLLSSNTGEG